MFDAHFFQPANVCHSLSEKTMQQENRRKFVMNALALSAAACFAGNALAQGNADATSTWDRIAATKTIRIGAVPGAPPNYQKDPATGEWSGIMIDLAKNLAGKLNASLEIRETTWGNSVLDLQTNKIDIFFGLNPTPQRQEVIDFSEPLYQNAYSLIAKKNFNVKTWDELNKPEVTIAVDIGSSYDNLVTTMYDKAKILRFEKSNDATLAVQTGRADVQPLVITVSSGIVKKNPNIGHLVVPEPVKGATTNAGFRKEQSRQWVEYVNNWIAEQRKDGTVNNTVLSNLDKLMGIKRSEIPVIVNF
jgi:polar amino acid transport system substrate-binding protein